MGLFSEIRRRNVDRIVVLYVVAAWLIMQVAEVLISLRVLPPSIGPVTFALLAIGLPIFMAIAWYFEITPEGIKRERDVDRAESITHITGRRIDFIVIAMLSAAIMLFAYHTWWPRGPLDQSIAVLPFENMSGDPEQEYFSDGLSEELLNLLAQFPELRVISRSSSFSFKGKDADLRTIAEQLNVSHVLEGAVRRSGDRVRVTAQLIEARSDAHLWSETYERELSDIFAVQDEITEAIGEVLKVKLALVEDHPAVPKVFKTASADAYDTYLKGRELLRKRGSDNLESAIRHFERVLRLDDGFAPAHANLAIATLLFRAYHQTKFKGEEVKRFASRHLDRAQELEPELAEAHGGRALLALQTGDPDSAIEHAKLALASNPSYVDAMNWLYLSLSRVGRYEEHWATLKQMLVSDPLSTFGLFNYCWELRVRGLIDEAREIADRLVLQRKDSGYRAHGLISLLGEGDIDRALYWLLKAEAEHIDSFRGYYSRYAAFAFMWVGESEEARRVTDSVSYSVDVAEGRFDEAVRATQDALQQRPENELAIEAAANVLYEAGRYHAALPLYERLRDFVPEGRPIPRSRGTAMRLAVVRRMAGDEEGARVAADIVRKDLPALERLGLKHLGVPRAMLAAFEGEPARAIIELKSAVRMALRDPRVLRDPIFEQLWGDPRFVAVQEELDAILAEEHASVLQLICFNNPIPNHWQPLPQTCEGVVGQRVH